MKVFIDNTINEKGEVRGQLYVESDERQFAIKEYTGKISTDKNGKETELFNTIGYYPSITHCMKRIITMKIKESTATTLQELHDDVKRIEQFVESKFAGY